jgi:hypothetical protein
MSNTATKKDENTTITFGKESIGGSTFYATEPMQLKTDPSDLQPIKMKKEPRHGPGTVEYFTDEKGNIVRRRIGKYEYQKRCEGN